MRSVACRRLSDGIPSRVQLDGIPAPRCEHPGAVVPARRPGAPPPPSRAGKASVTAWFAPAVRRQLRRPAADRDTTLQALLGEAVNDLFAKHGLPELVERD